MEPRNFLVAVFSCRVSRHYGFIAIGVFRGQHLQRGCRWAPLRSRDSDRIRQVLVHCLHAGHKTVVTEKNLAVEILPNRLFLYPLSLYPLFVSVFVLCIFGYLFSSKFVFLWFLSLYVSLESY